MYQITRTDRGLNVLLGPSIVMSDLYPEVALDDGTSIAPELVDDEIDRGRDRWGSFTRHRFLYADAETSFLLTLGFRIYPSVLVADVSYMQGGSGGIGRRPPGLAARDGILIHVGDLGSPEALMANYLFKDWWTRPFFETDLTQLPGRTQSLVWKDAERYHHLLPICDTVLKTELQGGDQGLEIATAAYVDGYCNVSAIIFALASDEDPFVLPDRTALAGFRALGTPARMRWHRRYPEPFEYLGWCSWDAFYREVSADGVAAKAQELSEKDVPVRWFIIDDGWLSTDEGRLTSFEPDGERFPDGFIPLVDTLKEMYGLQWLGVWHTLFGYWQGVHPHSVLSHTFRDALHTTHAGTMIPSPEVSRSFAFWNTWHSYLRNSGVDFVKVDYQSGLPTFLEGDVAIGKAATVAHHALEASVGKSFDLNLINCMGMASENLWHRPTSAVTRSSDDFFPEREGSFAEHALQNAYNAYYHGSFMWLDWDMWWTQHPYAATHAVLRAVSGGPIYISDRVGETDPTQLHPLVLSDGRILRGDRPGVVTEDCLMRNPNHDSIPLKVWNTVGDVGVIAAVNANVDDVEVTGSVGPGDVPGLSGERFVIFEHFGRQAQFVHRDERLSVSLEPQTCALYHVVPAVGPFTPLGLVDRYLSAASIADWLQTPERTTVVLLDGGTFGWAASSPPASVRVNGIEVAWEVDGSLYTVECEAVGSANWVEVVHVDEAR
jgi:raffinose synthase